MWPRGEFNWQDPADGPELAGVGGASFGGAGMAAGVAPSVTAGKTRVTAKAKDCLRREKPAGLFRVPEIKSNMLPP
jgi:hypothetical protein